MATAVALTAGALIASTQSATAEAIVGQPAPAFTGVTSNGETVSLDELSGKTVVLEWTNHGCPFVQKHYDESRTNMQGLQASANGQGVFVDFTATWCATCQVNKLRALNTHRVRDALEAKNIVFMTADFTR
ncbi:MAG: thioredoxin family protein, partial [Pseudomonadota bacterium]